MPMLRVRLLKESVKLRSKEQLGSSPSAGTQIEG
jgi:hypothetical protein